MSKRSRLRLPWEAYKALLQRVFTRDNWKCRSCKTRNDLHGHHIVYRSQGGDDCEENLIALCNYCHDAVHAHSLVILAGSGNIDDPIDANKPVRFLRIGGWKPK